MSFIAGFKRQLIVAVALWVLAVAIGIGILGKYSATPGRPAAPPLDWPASARLERGNGRATLVMFVHPHCPCSRASLEELAKVMAHTVGKLDANVFFYLPSSEASTWGRTDLWRTAHAIPGVRTFEDRDAIVARSFGAFTSGQTLLYSPGGRLLFKGGITAFRGHSGDNDGRSAVIALLQDENVRENALPLVTRVFGCSLRGEY